MILLHIPCYDYSQLTVMLVVGIVLGLLVGIVLVALVTGGKDGNDNKP